MARARIYRHDVRCPDCGSNWVSKYGKSGSHQKYRCNDCHRYFVPDAQRRMFSEATRQQAVTMYCEGTNVNAISRIVGAKHGTVYAWIKKSPVGATSDGSTCATGSTKPSQSGLVR